MKDVIVGGHRGEFIGVKQVIKGIRNPIYNEATGQTTITGDGVILWDISDNRASPHFLLAYKKRS